MTTITNYVRDTAGLRKRSNTIDGAKRNWRSRVTAKSISGTPKMSQQPYYLKRLVCLAHSTKKGDRCIAGKDIVTGEWIRPVGDRPSAAVEFGEYRYEKGHSKILDIIKIPLLRPEPRQHQTENHVIHAGYYWTKEGQVAWGDLAQYLDRPSSLWLNGRVVPQSIHGIDIVKTFLAREPVLSPLDYIKHICHESSWFYPVYFFIQQTRVTIQQVIAELEMLEVRGSQKQRLIDRLRTTENLTLANLTANTEQGQLPRKLHAQLIEKTCTDEEAEANLAPLFQTITHLSREQADPQFILPLLQRTALRQYAQLPTTELGYMRKAICRLDILWYKASSRHSPATTGTS